MPSLLKPAAKRARPLEHVVQFVAAQNHVGQRTVRRIVHPTAETQFFFIEDNKIVLRRILHRVVLRKISLQNHFAGDISASGTSGNLRQQLKCSFSSAEIGEAKSSI